MCRFDILGGAKIVAQVEQRVRVGIRRFVAGDQTKLTILFVVLTDEQRRRPVHMQRETVRVEPVGFQNATHFTQEEVACDEGFLWPLIIVDDPMLNEYLSTAVPMHCAQIDAILLLEQKFIDLEETLDPFVTFNSLKWLVHWIEKHLPSVLAETLREIKEPNFQHIGSFSEHGVGETNSDGITPLPNWAVKALPG